MCALPLLRFLAILFACSNAAAFLSQNRLWGPCRTRPGLLKMAAPTAGIIVGGGRIGNFLHESNDKKDLLLGNRADSIPAGESGPIYVCTRNDDLDALIEKTPAERKEDLVFLQNGILTNYLRKKGLSHNTQGLIYFAVSKKGEKPIDGVTDLSPEGLTAITGKWAEDFAARMKNAGLSCHVLGYKEWEVAMIEKHIWICAFMAVGAKHKASVGQVEMAHTAEVKELIEELAYAASLETKVVLPEGLADRLCAYARSVAHFPTALKEFEWRNGWFADITFRRAGRLQEDPCPRHTQILQEQGLLYKARKDFVRRSIDGQDAVNFAWFAGKEAEEELRESARQRARDSAEGAAAPRLPLASSFKK